MMYFRHIPKQKMIISDNPEEEVHKFINEHFHLLMPFIVHDTVECDIRVKREVMEKLTEKQQDELVMLAKGRDNITKEESERINGLKQLEKINPYIRSFYFEQTDSFILWFKLQDSYAVEARCEFGYEGVEDSVDYFFVCKRGYHGIIINNLGKDERDEFTVCDK